MKGKKTAKTFDYVIILAVILFAALTFFLFTVGNDKGGKLQVLIHSEAGDSFYDITEDKILSVSSNGHNIKIEIKDNAVKIVETDCPNQYCKEAGEIKSNGQIIICVPAVLYIKVVSSEVGENDPDIIIG